MKYISTRGGSQPHSFFEAVLEGLAPDGGLFVPESIPSISQEIGMFSSLSYKEIAFRVMRPFIGDELSDASLSKIIDKSYSTFDSSEVTPSTKAGDSYILELFHGPTLAFKDVALQFLGNLFEEILSQKDRKLNILAATSGDTGSAAIEGVKRLDNVNIFVMHPAGRVAPLQEKQMTTVLSDNVFNIAIDGSFDDCQNIMKECFSDLDFKAKYELGAVNSVNWARILAQVVYYFYAWSRLAKSEEKISFAVPSGNFGDIFAGWIAKKMGLPVDKLVICTNQNNILDRFFKTGEYSRGEVHFTLSPAMDIQISSNFERYLYFYNKQDAAKTKEQMDGFKSTGTLNIGGKPQSSFLSHTTSDEKILTSIKDCFDKTGEVIDPHTATAWHAVQQLDLAQPKAILATAHPAKFTDAVKSALGKEATHPTLEALKDLPERKFALPADAAAVKDFLLHHLA